MVIVCYKKHHIRLPDKAEGHISVTGIYRISPWRIHQGYSLPGKRTIIINFNPFNKAGFILLSCISSKVIKTLSHYLSKP